MKKTVFCIAVTIALLLSLAACGATEPTVSAALKHSLAYLGGEVKTVEPNAGDPHTMVCVYTEYTNNSGETALPADYVNVKAFQNGKEIPILVFTGTKIDDYIQCDTAVQDGVTAKVIWTFQPEDESEINIELSSDEKYTISGTVVDAPLWPITEMPVSLRYDRMWIYSAYAETEDAAVIANIVAAVNALSVGDPSDVFVMDYTDILTFSFADGITLRLEFEENNWVKNDNERYHVDGLASLRGLLDGLIEEKQAEAIRPVGMLVIEANGHTFYAALEDNSSAEAFAANLSSGPINVDMHDYGNFEKVGSLPWSLPRNDEDITTVPGDVILYQGNQITIYYDQNTWDFTRLAKIGNTSREELPEAFGNGNVTVAFWVEWGE